MKNHTVEMLFLVKGNTAFVHFTFDFVSRKVVHEGRAIAQAASSRLPIAVARVQNRVWSCGIL
jgi:hypothetical protein